MAVSPIRSLAGALALAAARRRPCAAAPATIRVDYLHSGNALSDTYAIERVLVEPLPWPGDLAQNLDNTDRGQNRVEVVDAKTGDLLYSRGFSTIFGEWRTTDEANKISRGFHESVRFPRAGQAGAGAHPQARRAQPVFGGVERRRRRQCAGRDPQAGAGAGAADPDPGQRTVAATRSTC